MYYVLIILLLLSFIAHPLHAIAAPNNQKSNPPAVQTSPSPVQPTNAPSVTPIVSPTGDVSITPSPTSIVQPTPTEVPATITPVPILNSDTITPTPTVEQSNDTKEQQVQAAVISEPTPTPMDIPVIPQGNEQTVQFHFIQDLLQKPIYHQVIQPPITFMQRSLPKEFYQSSHLSKTGTITLSTLGILSSMIGIFLLRNPFHKKQSGTKSELKTIWTAPSVLSQ